MFGYPMFTGYEQVRSIVAAGWLYDSLHHYELAFWLCAGAFLLAVPGLLVIAQLHHDHERAGTQLEEDAAGNRG